MVKALGAGLVISAGNLAIIAPLLAGFVLVLRLLRARNPASGVPMWGFVIIPDGERWKVTHASASVHIAVGPQVIRVWGATMCPLKQFVAASDEYLVVRHVSGHSEVRPGPTSLHMDPATLLEVKVHKAV